MLENFVMPQIQQHQCLDSIAFMKDGAPPHIGLYIQQFLWHYFTDDRVTSRVFPTIWPPRLPDLNPCDFWLWGYLKNLVYRGSLSFRITKYRKYSNNFAADYSSSPTLNPFNQPTKS